VRRRSASTSPENCRLAGDCDRGDRAPSDPPMMTRALAVRTAAQPPCPRPRRANKLALVGDTARERFLATLGATRRAAFRALPDWEKRLDDVLDEPAKTLDAGWRAREDFAAEIGSRLDRDAESVASFWDHLRAADLYLACA